jgi:vanillate/3-O-methylgallate O-demethylase
MAERSLDDWVRAQTDLIDTFRRQGGYYDHNFPVVPDEKTNWIDELRAIVETCALADLSHHMTALHLEGPDTVRLLKDLCVNDFDDFEIGQAKQIVMCNHHGHLMGDGPLLRLDDDEFYGPGVHATKWLQFNLETGDYDVSADIEPPTPLLPGDPAQFVYQLQGPNAHAVLEQLTDADLEAIGFYRFADITIAGRTVRAFGHGMSPEAGFELHGPFEHADGVRDALLEAGRAYGLRQLGSRTYVSNSVRVGWVPPHPRPVYDIDEMAAYRRWADGDKERKYGKWGTSEEPLEATFSLEGSFDSDDLRDYYLSPVELGYGPLIDFDHEFVGKDALAAEVAAPERTLVSLIWDTDDVERVATSIFGDGENYKYLDNLPRIGWARQAYDRVERDGRLVGISHGRSFQWDVRGMVSLCRIDVEQSDPGTEVTLVWGEPDGTSPNPKIEDHTPTEIAATVKPAPYTADKRGS